MTAQSTRSGTVVFCRMRLRWVLLPLVLVSGCSQGTTSPTTAVLIVNGYTIEADAKLGLADLRAANLRGKDLSGANLSRANLSGVDLYGVRLSGATMPDGTIHP